MHYAAYCGSTEIVRLLRDRGGDADKPDDDGQTSRELMPEAFVD